MPRLRGERPKNLDGIAGAKIDVRRGIRRLHAQVKAMEECFDAALANEMVPHAHAAVLDASHIAEAAGAWAALAGVADRTYRRP
jgi:thiazole synthase ThiGH ThiG subunit